MQLPEGDPADEPGTPTVCGLGNLKDAEVNRILATDGVQPYPGSVAWLDALIAGGTKVAVVSSSRNTRTVLAAAGLADRFEVVVDGVRAAAEHLPGKPRPDTYLQAARDLGVPVERAVVVEDAVSGVAAGRAGGFGLVLGVDRGVGRDALRRSGADLVVADLAELLPMSRGAHVAGRARLPGLHGPDAVPGRPVAADRGVLQRRGPGAPPRRCSRSATATWASAAPTRRAATPCTTARSSTACTRPGGSGTPSRPTGSRRSGQTIVTAPDATIFELYVDDEPMVLSVADLMSYQRTLDMLRRRAAA